MAGKGCGDQVGRPRKFDPDVALGHAMRVFWQKGFADTSYDDLVAATGVNRPSLYAAYGDKQSLYRKALAKYFDTYGASALEELSVGTGSVSEDIENWFAKAARSLTDRRHPSGCFVVLSICEECAELQELGVGYVDRFRSAFVDKLQGHVADAVVTGHALLSLYLGMGLQARAGASRAELEAVARKVALLLK